MISLVHTIGLVLIVWFIINDCILVKSGQIANPIIATVNPANINGHIQCFKAREQIFGF